MGISFGNFLQGLNSAELIIRRSSYNIANINTEGYRSVNSLTGQLPDDKFQSENPLNISDVDIAKEQVSQIMAVTSYKANLNGIKTVDEIAGEILDIKA